MSQPFLTHAAAPLAHAAFVQALRERLQAGARALSYFGEVPASAPDAVLLTAVLLDSGALGVLRGLADPAAPVPALTLQFPQLHMLEREIHEQTGLAMPGHPWLKPVRSTRQPMDAYPFYALHGKEVHEVGVGPIHAGVIEPGHFRFQCLGEVVHHLEIQLGYQHRGIEPLLAARPIRHALPVVETVAGDTSIGHAWAYCRAVEALAGVQVPASADAVRGVALELERIAMHLTGLAGIATDIGFLQGGTTWGRLRTAIINSSMLICGSRFGRGWLRPGGVRFGVSRDQAAQLTSTLRGFQRDMEGVTRLFTSSLSVNDRLHGVGRLQRAQAEEIGLVGMAARTCGLAMDLRTDLPGAPYATVPVPVQQHPDGDCWARALLRVQEIDASVRWLLHVLETLDLTTPPVPDAATLGLAAETLAIGLCEGWRGEVLYALQTDAAGRIRHVKVQDPSLRNWFGLAQCLRGNEISDFPICNKSFDLSYAGHDL